MQNLLSFIQTSGVSAPLFSLANRDDLGIGDFHNAYLFIDFLDRSSQSVWKMLPIHETSESNGFSPYDPISVFAIDPVYVDIYDLDGLDDEELNALVSKNKIHLHQTNKVHFKEVLSFKISLLRYTFKKFYENEFLLNTTAAKHFQDYINLEEYWIYDYAAYKIISKRFNDVSHEKWDYEYKVKGEKLVKKVIKESNEEALFYMYVQWILHLQLKKLKDYANSKGIYLVGDISFYPGIYSIDVWSNPELFWIDENLAPLAYGGTPADDFSEKGQKWDVGVYRWDKMKEDGYKFIYERVNKDIKYFDGLRLDHFRGYIKYWHIDAKTLDASWQDGAGVDFLNDLVKRYSDKEHKYIFGENLGVITPDVISAQKTIDIDGYIIFIFSYRDIFLHNVDYSNLIETTTHDTIPLKVWWTMLTDVDKKDILSNTIEEFDESELGSMSDNLRWKIIEKVFAQPFQMRLIPLVDLLGSSQIINVPGSRENNWNYRMEIFLEDLLSDFGTISKLDLYSSIFCLNKYFVNFDCVIQPRVKNNCIRKYRVGEDIYVYALCKEASDIRAVTNVISREGEVSPGEYLFEEEQETSSGFLYVFHTKAKIPGEYYFTIKKDGKYLGNYESDLHILIED